MKWILFWIFYSSSVQEEIKITGRLIVQSDSITFYTVQDGYRTFPIVASNNVIVSERFEGGPPELMQGLYLLKQDTTFVTVFIHSTHIEYTIRTPKTYDRVKLRRK